MGAHEFQAICYPDFTGDGLLDLLDFLCFVNAFNEGCSSNGALGSRFPRVLPISRTTVTPAASAAPA